MPSPWNGPWNNAKTRDKDVGQKSPYSKVSGTNLGKAQCRAEGATQTTKGQHRAGANKRVSQGSGRQGK